MLPLAAGIYSGICVSLTLYLFPLFQVDPSSVVVKRLHCYHRDVGSNPTTTRNENQTLGTPLQKVVQGPGQDLSGRPAM